jgi:hypothetical protein
MLDMSKLFPIAVVCMVAGILGAGAAVWLLRQRDALPDPPAVVEKVREVARLETVELTLYKKISFEPEPVEAASFWGDVANWVRFTVRKPQGRAIVFAQVELGLDLQRLDPSHLRLHGTRAEVMLPPIEAQVRLLPAETEIIGSNLDSAETAQLFERAREAFEREVMADPRLRDKAREASERAIRALLITLGYREVVFVQQPLRAEQTG